MPKIPGPDTILGILSGVDVYAEDEEKFLAVINGKTQEEIFYLAAKIEEQKKFPTEWGYRENAIRAARLYEEAGALGLDKAERLYREVAKGLVTRMGPVPAAQYATERLAVMGAKGRATADAAVKQIKNMLDEVIEDDTPAWGFENPWTVNCNCLNCMRLRAWMHYARLIEEKYLA